MNETSARIGPVSRRCRAVVAAPEVAARVVARRAAGELPADIARELHMTPLEVGDVLRAAEQGVSR